MDARDMTTDHAAERKARSVADTHAALEAMFRASALAELVALAERADLAAITRAIEAMEVRG